MNKPTIICLCGSVKFDKEFELANRNETLKGKIVLSIGCNMKTDPHFNLYEYEELIGIKGMLDELHKRKIDLADEVLFLNVGGYMGNSTKSELSYAKKKKKIIYFLEPINEK